MRPCVATAFGSGGSGARFKISCRKIIMADETRSLLTGRNVAPLSEEQIRRAINTFLGLDRNVTVRYLENSPTVFRVSLDADGHEYGEIVFGPDLYPGPNI